MFAGSFLPGYLPICLFSSGMCTPQKMKLLNAIGAGLLVSTALAVILPEGVHQLVIAPNASISSHGNQLYAANFKEENKLLKDSKERFFGSRSEFEDVKSTQTASPLNDEHDHSGFDEDRLRYIGLSLSGGFLFMMIVEKLSESYCGGDGHSHGLLEHDHKNEDQSDEHSHGGGDEIVELDELKGHVVENTNRRRKVPSVSRSVNAASIGLIIHCAVDGIAMGSVGASQNKSQEFIVFLAILLHKAPSAIGITGYLMQHKLSQSKSMYFNIMYGII
jgi:zinc transporter 9